MRSSKGFTLIELVMVIVILGILAALAIPRFIDLQDSAASAAADGAIGGIRTAVSAYYAQQATSGSASFPASITTDLFADGQLPTFTTPYTYTYSSSTGVVSKLSNAT